MSLTYVRSNTELKKPNPPEPVIQTGILSSNTILQSGPYANAIHTVVFELTNEVEMLSGAHKWSKLFLLSSCLPHGEQYDAE